MMPPRSSSRRVSAATRWLIRAFSPGGATLLRSWDSRPERCPQAGRVERLTIHFDLPDDAAFARAVELAAAAASLTQVRIGRDVIRSIIATVSDQHRVLTVVVLLARFSQGNRP